MQSTLDAVQIFGGYGYMTEQEVERDLRDAVGSTLYSGTSEIQRNIIAQGLWVSEVRRMTCRSAYAALTARPLGVDAARDRASRSAARRWRRPTSVRFVLPDGAARAAAGRVLSLRHRGAGLRHAVAADRGRLRHPLLAAVRVEGAVLHRVVARRRVRDAAAGDGRAADRDAGWRSSASSRARCRSACAAGAVVVARLRVARLRARDAGLRHPVRVLAGVRRDLHVPVHRSTSTTRRTRRRGRSCATS